MNCPFYGRHTVLRGAAFPILIAQQGNQCAVITTAYSPCRMEIDGQEPDWRTCPLLEIDVFGSLEERG